MAFEHGAGRRHDQPYIHISNAPQPYRHDSVRSQHFFVNHLHPFLLSPLRTALVDGISKRFAFNRWTAGPFVPMCRTSTKSRQEKRAGSRNLRNYAKSRVLSMYLYPPRASHVNDCLRSSAIRGTKRRKDKQETRKATETGLLAIHHQCNTPTTSLHTYG